MRDEVGNGVYIICFSPRCPRGSLVPYKSEENQFCGALLTERTVCGMEPSCFKIEKVVIEVRKYFIKKV